MNNQNTTPPRRGRTQQAPHAAHHGHQPASSGDWFKTGGAAITHAQEDQEASQARFANQKLMPYRHYLGIQGSLDGNNRPAVFECGVLFLDAEFPGFQYREHEFSLQNPRSGKHGRPEQEGCPSEWDECPLCSDEETFKRSYVANMASVITTIGFTSKTRGTVRHSKKLMCIKPMQMSEFVQIYAAAIQEQGDPSQGGRGMRGVYVWLRRDNSQNCPKIGKPVMQAGGKMFTIIPEAQLMAMFAHPAVVVNGVVTIPENDDCYAYNYRELFSKPDAADLRARYNFPPPAGSHQANAASWGQPAHAPQQGGFGAPPGGFQPPPQQGGFGAPPQGFQPPAQGGFGAPPQQAAFGAPPQQAGFQPPPQQAFGPPPGAQAPPMPNNGIQYPPNAAGPGGWQPPQNTGGGFATPPPQPPTQYQQPQQAPQQWTPPAQQLPQQQQPTGGFPPAGFQQTGTETADDDIDYGDDTDVDAQDGVTTAAVPNQTAPPAVDPVQQPHPPTADGPRRRRSVGAPAASPNPFAGQTGAQPTT